MLVSRASVCLLLVAAGCGSDSNVSGDAAAPVAGSGAADAAVSSSPDDPTGDGGSDSATGPSQTLIGDDVPAPRVGILYAVWHTPAATAMRNIAATGSTPVTVEDVLASGGTIPLANVLEKYQQAGPAMDFYYNTHPASGGFYCLYRARPATTGLVPDCPDITATATRHAEQLLAAGIDFVVIDASNLTGLDDSSDELQIRPTQVLFEEWQKLRAAGQKTPQIAVWNPIPTGAEQWQKYVALYDDPAYDGLVMHDKKTGKKVFFVTDNSSKPDPTILAQIESNGGKQDIVVQRMWTIGATDTSVDRWSFMSACMANGQATTSIVGQASCAQPYTPKSTLGSQIAVVPSFQTGYGSLPFSSAGKLGGLTLQQQWATALRVRPDYVLVSGWNELVAQPQPNPYSGNAFARSMGLEEDPDGSRLFVDTYGAEFGRDLEPTVDRGDADYQLLSSCVRVFRSGAIRCDDASEACCATATASAYVNVWTLVDSAGTDALLTTNRGERDTLVAGGGWREVCARFGTPSTFCLAANESAAPFGPFIAYSVAAPTRRALYRCLDGKGHFFSNDKTCGSAKLESVIGWLGNTRSGEAPRKITACSRADGERFVAVGSDCPTDTTAGAILGYAH